MSTGAAPDRPIILLGCPRSGTTMLQVALHAHPRIALPPETWLLVDAYREREQFGDLTTRPGRERVADWVLGKKKVRDLRLDPAHARELLLDAPPTLGSMLGALLRAYSAQYGKPRWGDKRPAYYRDVAAVLRLFPDAQFIHLVRDGRSAVASLKRMTWWHNTVPETISAWSMSIDLGAQWQRRLGPASWHELQYERLVADPETELRRLCTFLGEDYDEAMIHPETVASVAVPKRKRKETAHHARTGRPMDSARVAAYREGLTPDELALMERVAGSRLQRYGYTLDGPGQVPPSALLHYRAVDTRRRLALARTHALDRARDLRLRDELACQLPPVQVAPAR